MKKSVLVALITVFVVGLVGVALAGPPVAVTNGEMKAFLQLWSELPSFGTEDADARAYVETLAFWMRGHLDWYRETARYPFRAEPAFQA